MTWACLLGTPPQDTSATLEKVKRSTRSKKPSEANPSAMQLLADLEKLLRTPGCVPDLRSVNSLAVAIARRSTRGQVANLAMRVVSAAGSGAPEIEIDAALCCLRAALEEEMTAVRKRIPRVRSAGRFNALRTEPASNDPGEPRKSTG